MRTQLSRMLFGAALGVALLATAGRSHADDRRDHRDDRRDDRQDRREEHHEEKREERHEERHDERREERRDDHRPVVVRDHRHPYEAPPAARVERHNERRGYTWVNGGYEWRNGRYEWSGGRYERERHGARWREPRWEVRDGVYVRVDGGWTPIAAPPPVRVERYSTRPGFVYVRGRWDWRGGEWGWTPGHYERERVGYIYREPRWEERDGVYVNVEGGWVVH